jgi:hypothetical protein
MGKAAANLCNATGASSGGVCWPPLERPAPLLALAGGADSGNYNLRLVPSLSVIGVTGPTSLPCGPD